MNLMYISGFMAGSHKRAYNSGGGCKEVIFELIPREKSIIKDDEVYFIKYKVIVRGVPKYINLINEKADENAYIIVQGRLQQRILFDENKPGSQEIEAQILVVPGEGAVEVVTCKGLFRNEYLSSR